MGIAPDSGDTKCTDWRPETGDPLRAWTFNQWVHTRYEVQGQSIMSATETEATTFEVGIGDRAGVICAVCPHLWEAHDRIGLRYCTATAAGALNRGCVCVGDTNPAAVSLAPSS